MISCFFVQAGMMRISSELATEETETDVSEQTVKPVRLAVHIGSYSTRFAAIASSVYDANVYFSSFQLFRLYFRVKI